MAESKKSRNYTEIQAEYQGLCTKAGHLQYQIDALGQDLALLNKSMRDLNGEAISIAQEEQKAAATAQVSSAGSAENSAENNKPQQGEQANG